MKNCFDNLFCGVYKICCKWIIDLEVKNIYFQKVKVFIRSFEVGNIFNQDIEGFEFKE